MATYRIHEKLQIFKKNKFFQSNYVTAIILVDTYRYAFIVPEVSVYLLLNFDTLVVKGDLSVKCPV